MTTLSFLIEAKLIRSGNHSGYAMGSDRIYNFETYCINYAKDSPQEARQSLIDIRTELSGLTSHAIAMSGITEYAAGVAASLIAQTLALQNH